MGGRVPAVCCAAAGRRDGSLLLCGRTGEAEAGRARFCCARGATGKGNWDGCMERRGNWQRRWRRCKRRLSIRRCRMRRIFGWRRFTGGWGRRRRGGGSRGFMRKFQRRRKRRWSGSGGNWDSLFLQGRANRRRRGSLKRRFSCGGWCGDGKRKRNKDNAESAEGAEKREARTHVQNRHVGHPA